MFGPFIRVTNSYNGLRALGFDVGFYRKVCKNGMIVPDTIVRFNFTHMQREIGETIQFLIARDRLEKFKTTFADSLVNLRTCAVPRTNFEPVVCSVLCLHPPEPMKPGGPHESDWQTLHSQITEMCNRYASELGETAYAIFNVVTELASRPPANRCLHRDRNSLQRLAGSWLKSFNDAYRRPDFSLGNHLEQLAKERSSTARSRTSNDAIN